MDHKAGKDSEFLKEFSGQFAERPLDTANTKRILDMLLADMNADHDERTARTISQYALGSLRSNEHVASRSQPNIQRQHTIVQLAETDAALDHRSMELISQMIQQLGVASSTSAANSHKAGPSSASARSNAPMQKKDTNQERSQLLSDPFWETFLSQELPLNLLHHDFFTATSDSESQGSEGELSSDGSETPPQSEPLRSFEFKASQLSLLCLTNLGKQEYDAFAYVTGPILVHWSGSMLSIKYRLPEFDVTWKLFFKVLRPGACLYRRLGYGGKGELLLSMYRPPDILLESRSNAAIDSTRRASVFRAAPTLPLPRTIQSRRPEQRSGYMPRTFPESYAIGANSTKLEKVGFQFMDSILLRVENTGNFESSDLYAYLRQNRFFPEYPGSFRVSQLSEDDMDEYLHTSSWHELSRTVRWKLCVFLSRGWLTPRAVDDEFVHILADVDEDVALRTLGFMEQQIIYSNKKLCVDNTMQVLQRFLEFKGEPIRPSNESGSFYVAHLQASPTKFYCLGPCLETSNRMLREYSDNIGNFLRLTFVSEDLGGLYVQREGYMLSRVRKLLQNGIQVFGRQFDFLIYSQSQIRSNSCWFLSNDGDVCVDKVISWMGDASNNKTAGKYAARLGLALTATRPALPLLPTEYELADDIRSPEGYEMTDGCGEISLDFAVQVALRLNEVHVPSAFQIRYAGFKGMLVVNRKLPRGIKVRFRKSMKKMESDANLLEICEVSKFRSVFTNRQVLLLQSNLGVPNDTLLARQLLYIRKLQSLIRSPKKATRFLFGGGMGNDRSWGMALANLLSNGFDLDEGFLKSTMQEMVRSALEMVRSKSRIRVDQGALLYGVYDFSGKLKPNEVVIQVSRPGAQGQNSRLKTIIGRVMVTRNPCMHLGDVRVLQAVEPPSELAHLEDVIVFSIQGDRPQSSKMGQGDMDGDYYSVYWDKRIIPPRESHPLVYTAKTAPEAHRKITLDDVKEFFVKHMLNNNIGKLAIAHLVWSDTHGPNHRNCVALARLANDAFQFAKTEVPAVFPRELKIEKYPDFLEKPKTFQTYRSTSILGMLWRQAKKGHRKFDFMTERQDKQQFEYDPLLHFDLTPPDVYNEILLWATETKRSYDCEMSNLMSHYEVRSEAAFFSGAFTAYADTPGRDRQSSENARVALKDLKTKYRCEFYKGLKEIKATGEAFDMVCIMRASAWYAVTYDPKLNGEALANADTAVKHAVAFRSFPWLVAEELIKLREFNLGQSKAAIKATTNAATKTLSVKAVAGPSQAMAGVKRSVVNEVDQSS